MIHSELLDAIPPKYQTLVPPSPIYVYDAILSVFYFNDLPNPNSPFIFNYFGTLKVSWHAIGKLNMPYSFD